MHHYLSDRKIWMGHPTIEYKKMDEIACIKNIKQGIHNIEDIEKILLDEIKLWFEGKRVDKRYNGRLRREIEEWDSELRQPKIEPEFKTHEGKTQEGELLTVTTTSLHYNHVMFIFQRKDIISKHYSILTKAERNQMMRTKYCNKNSFDVALVCNRITVENYLIITIDNLPKDFKSIKIEGEKDGLPKNAMGTTLGKFLSANSNFLSIERAEEPGRYHVVLKGEKNNSQKNINFETRVKKIIDKIGKNEDHQGYINAMKEFGAPPKIYEDEISNYFGGSDNAWYNYGEIDTSPEDKKWLNAAKQGNQMEDHLLNNETTYSIEERAQMINYGLIPDTINLGANQSQGGDLSIVGDTFKTKESIRTYISESVATQLTEVIAPLTKKIEVLTTKSQQTEEALKQEKIAIKNKYKQDLERIKEEKRIYEEILGRIE